MLKYLLGPYNRDLYFKQTPDNRNHTLPNSAVTGFISV